MPLVLKTLETFFLAKTRNRYYRIHTSIPPCPQTHTPLGYACGSSGSRAAPPPPLPELPLPPPVPASFSG